jgi:two-component system nitrogen regulation response regulator GlnG
MGHLLVIDDDDLLIPQRVRRALPDPAIRIDIATSGAAGLQIVRTDPPDVIVLELLLPDQSGLEVYKQIRRIDADVPVIFITMAKKADAAIEAIRHGAHDYLYKPLDVEQLRRVLGEALEIARQLRTQTVNTERHPCPAADDDILGSSAAMREVYKAMGRVAAQDVPVLITGES